MGRSFEVRKASMMKTGLQKAKLYARFGKEIYVCAKNGGSNPESNLALKHLIERAKKQQVPADIIKRNIDKAEGGGGEDYTTIRYEGFGPSGSSFIVDTLTDNVNRTVSEVRNCFTKIGSKLGVNGSVEHLYQHLAYVTVKGIDEDTVLETLLEKDIDIIDVEVVDDAIEISADGYALDKVENALSAIPNVEIIDSESGWYAHESVTLDDEDYQKFERFMQLTNQCEDVQNVYHNVKIKEENN